MIYGSLCSGIEAATQAWHPLGWTPAFFSEIEAFPSAVLAHHYPNVPNLGDMTKFQEWPDHAIDLLVGGTPCQSFSVAGLRKGLDDPRGDLMLTFGAVARRYRPRWIVWENVPGVLSSNKGRDFGTFLGMLAELGYGFAYRVLDAQYVRTCRYRGAVPQRRRRVFVVGYLGDWRRAAAVLFDRESLRGDPPPRREAGKGVANTISARPTGGGGLGTDFDCDGGLIASTGEVAHCLNAGGMGRIDYETETMVAHALRGEGFDASEDGSGRGTPIVPVAFGLTTEQTPKWASDHALTLTKQSPTGGGQTQCVAIQERAICENPDAGPDGVGVRQDGAAYTLESRTVPQAVAYRTAGDGAVYEEGAATAPLTTQTDPNAQVVAFDLRGREGGAMPEGPHDTAALRAASGGSSRSYVAERWAVRRLTPVECHRLQGFPDGFCNIPWRGKDHAPDGPQYKALGNSMAVNCMSWIGRRIGMVDGM